MIKRLEDYNKVLPILELYTAVQSEGSRAGYPTIVVRTSGCTHRCYFGEGGWCDNNRSEDVIDGLTDNEEVGNRK